MSIPDLKYIYFALAAIALNMLWFMPAKVIVSALVTIMWCVFGITGYHAFREDWPAFKEQIFGSISEGEVMEPEVREPINDNEEVPHERKERTREGRRDVAG